MIEDTTSADPDGTGEGPSIEDIVLDHVGQIGALQEGMQTLVEMMDELLSVPPKNKPAPWNWKELTGPDAAKLALLARDQGISRGTVYQYLRHAKLE